MRITLDTDTLQIIVPDTFYKTIDKRNEVLEQAGISDKKIDYYEYVKSCFEKAYAKPWIRKSDLPKKVKSKKEEKPNVIHVTNIQS